MLRLMPYVRKVKSSVRAPATATATVRDKGKLGDVSLRK